MHGLRVKPAMTGSVGDVLNPLDSRRPCFHIELRQAVDTRFAARHVIDDTKRRLQFLRRDIDHSIALAL